MALKDKVTATARYPAEDAEDRRLFEAMTEAARGFVESFDWCRGIREEYIGIAVPGIVGVYLFRIGPTDPGVDEWIWVIVGDLPPAYITTDEAPNPAAALDGYIG